MSNKLANLKRRDPNMKEKFFDWVIRLRVPIMILFLR